MPSGHHRLKSPSDAVFDTFTAPSAAFDFRKVKSSYSGPGIRIRRASDNQEIDINYLGFVPGIGAPIDVATANTHCTSTTCYGRWWYDQSGAAWHIGQATAANQPELIFNCRGTLPCWRFTANTQNLTSASNFTPATGIVTVNAVAIRTTGTGTCQFVSGASPGNRMVTAATANWSVGTTQAAAANGVWHAAVGIFNGAAPNSSLTIDANAAVTGGATGTTTPGPVALIGGATTTCLMGAATFWDNYMTSAGETTVLIANQRGFWGF